MGSGSATFSWVGHTDGHHNLAHAADVARMREINTWYSEQLAYLMGELDKHVDVDGGSMLDSTLIVWWNELGDGAAHRCKRAPFVLAGGAGALQHRQQLEAGNRISTTESPATAKPPSKGHAASSAASAARSARRSSSVCTASPP
jgi:hypothetical protein